MLLMLYLKLRDRILKNLIFYLKFNRIALSRLLSSDDYLQEALTKKSSMVYKIDKYADIAYVKKVLTNRNINFVIT